MCVWVQANLAFREPVSVGPSPRLLVDRAVAKEEAAKFTRAVKTKAWIFSPSEVNKSRGGGEFGKTPTGLSSNYFSSKVTRAAPERRQSLEKA